MNDTRDSFSGRIAETPAIRNAAIINIRFRRIL